jgi:hypothetical protein
MKTRRCVACGKALLSSARIDKLTCDGACRTRLCRQRAKASDTSVTGSGSVAARSDAGWGNEPVGSLGDAQDGLDRAEQLALWAVAEPQAQSTRGEP